MLTLPAAPRLISPYCDLISLPLLHSLFLWWANLLIPQLTSISPWRGEAEGVDGRFRVISRVVGGYINTPTTRLGRVPLLAYR